jgi:hypothetical protein
MKMTMKNPLKKLLCAIFAFAAVGYSAALTVSLAPAQTMLSSDGPESPAPMDTLMSGCLDSLFDAGMIATNAPTQSIDLSRWSDVTFGLSGAKEGFVDYVVAFFVTWRPSSLKKEIWLALSCTYRIVRVSDGQVVASGSAPGETDVPELLADPEKSVRSMGTSLGKSCAALIRSVSNGGEL